jgi:hormone-sensitive lipase
MLNLRTSFRAVTKARHLYLTARCYTNNTTIPAQTHGLKIHASRHIKNDACVEHTGTIARQTLDTIQKLKDDLRTVTWYTGDPNHLYEYKDSVDKILEDLKIIQESVQKKYSFLPTAQTPIQSFVFDFRGLLLTIQYTMASALESIHASRDKIEKHARKMKVLQSLTQMSVILAKERETAVQDCSENYPEINIQNAVYYPFSDSIDINKYEQFKTLDAADYFEDIGQQFAPMMRLFLSLMVNVTASHNASLGYHPLFRRGIFYASNLYYLLNAREAAQQTKEFMSTLTTQNGKALWQMPDTDNVVKTLSFLTLPDIELSATFTIPLMLPESTSSTNIKERDVKVTEKLAQTPTETEIIGESTMKELDYYSNQTANILASGVENIKKDIQIRIISSKPLNEPTTEAGRKLQIDYPSLSAIRRTISTTRKVITEIISGEEKALEKTKGFIFHVHGGGFIALSSFAHECYLRPWATETQLPIFSVDYSKTPDYHYPVQLEECYQSYKWILENAEAMGVDTSKIIFAGDSAGGNLVLAVLIRAIHEGIRKPDAIVLTYPATYLQFSASPARIVSLLDPLLNFKLLELCGLEYYLNPNSVHVKNNAQRNALISPSVVPDEILKQFPKMMLNVGSLDPLFDDSIYLAKRMESINGPESVQLNVYDGLAHGFLNLVDAIPEAKDCSKGIIDWVNQL